ncbi:hypothetical protein CULT_2220003 [[Clostridium] ultunense Esp]|nr:hypothetical protein CULT_2220003 [[Clostridium] ultunense Esp]
MKLVGRYPKDPIVNYYCAWSFDALGLEKMQYNIMKKPFQ